MPRIVQRSPELARVLSLPTRRWEDATTPAACEALSRHLRAPGGKLTLFPVQTAILAEYHDWGGVLAQAGVGHGKTIPSATVASVTEGKRPMVVVPANLREKTVAEFRAIAGQFRVAPVRVESYQTIGRSPSTTLLDTLRPDRLILDECHLVKNPQAGVTRKFTRHIRERRRPLMAELAKMTPLEGVQWWLTLTPQQRWAWLDVCVLAESGTLAKRSILDFWHIANWISPVLFPFPMHRTEVLNWAAAVDEKVSETARAEPGALSLFGGEGDDELEAARRGLQRRIFSTPGFIATTSNDVADCSLTIECVQIHLSPEVQAMYTQINKFLTPCDLDIPDGISRWRHSRELAADFYYRPKVVPPVPWMAVRRLYFSAVRKYLGNQRHGLDTLGDVEKEIRRDGASHPCFKEWQEWQEMEPTFTLETEPVWCATHCLDFVKEWASRNVGLIWVEWPIVGQRLAKALGVEYYGRQGENARGQRIDAEGVEDGSRCAVASIEANHMGRNLQGIWSKALVTSAPPTGTKNEQMIARLHRNGQLADNVHYTYMIACRAQVEGFIQSMRDAGFHATQLGSAFKLNPGGKSADLVIPAFRETGGAWALPSKVDLPSGIEIAC